MIKALDEKRMFDSLMPALRAILKAGGGADKVLKQSEPLAAVNLVKHAASEDEGIALKASIEILNRVSGKPVERSINVYADTGRLSDRDLDSQIQRLIKQSGAKQFLQQTLDVTPKKKGRKAQKRKPRVSEFTPEVTDGPEETQ